MNINRLTCSGLFSYTTESSIEFSDHTVIVGPNNGGKSNIFRIMRILVDALYRGKRPSEFEMSRTENRAFAEAEITLSPEECRLLEEFFGYHYTENRQLRLSELPIHVRAGNFFSSVTIRIEWMKGMQGAGSSPRIRVGFPRCGLKLSARPRDAEFWVSGIDEPDAEHSGERIGFFEFCALVFENNDPKTGFESFKASNKAAVHEPVSFDKMTDMPPEEIEKTTALKQRLFRGDEVDRWTLPHVLGSIMRDKTAHASASSLTPKPFAEMGAALMKRQTRGFKSKALMERHAINNEIAEHYNSMVAEQLRAMDLEDSKKLSSDGSNMTRFLFTLKNSPRHQERTAFKKIQTEFSRVFEGLEVDVALNYDRTRWVKSRLSVPSFPQILFADQSSPGSVTQEQIGTGALQVLYLLSAVHGRKDSLVLLDEPGINLHPTMLQTIMGALGTDGETNQFVIITHSAELLSYEIFDKGGDVVYVSKSGNGSRVLGSGDNPDLGKWWNKNRKNLRHQIDVRVFFSNLVVLVEGPSDHGLLAGVAEYKSREDQKYNLARKNIVIVGVGSNCNFGKHARLLNAYKIPYVILADSDDTKWKSKAPFKNKKTVDFGESFVKSDIVLVKGKLESMLESIDKRAFQDADRRERSKVSTAIAFCEKVQEKEPQKLNPVVEFLDCCVGLVPTNLHEPGSVDRAFRGAGAI